MDHADDETAPHIDRSKTHQNYNWTCYDSENYSPSFKEAERIFYEYRYADGLEAKNTRYRHEGHADRCKTVDDLLKGDKTQPDEMLLQIGSHKDGTVEPIILYNAAMDLINDMINDSIDRSGYQHLTVINFAVHVDETTPHIHIRYTMDSPDRDGNPVLGENRALKDLGYDLPDPSKREGKFNNRKIAFTSKYRDRFCALCKDRGLEIETDPRPRRRHLDKADYIAQQKQEELDNLNKQISTKQQELDAFPEAIRLAQENYDKRKQEIDAKLTEEAQRDDDRIQRADRARQFAKDHPIKEKLGGKYVIEFQSRQDAQDFRSAAYQDELFREQEAYIMQQQRKLESDRKAYSDMITNREFDERFRAAKDPERLELERKAKELDRLKAKFPDQIKDLQHKDLQQSMSTPSRGMKIR